MGQKTTISWTHHTFSPWWGCQRVSPGCEHCYAETFSKRVGLKVWGPTTERRFFGDKHWRDPLKWDREAKAAGERRRVFCASMADVFEDRPDLVAPRARLLQLIDQCDGLDWLLLTKRPENIRRMTAPLGWSVPGFADPIVQAPRNVWIGTTAEDQKRADERTRHILGLGTVSFLSCEPLLGPITLRCTACGLDTTAHYQEPHATACCGMFPDWVILGGESGGGSRPFDIQWARSLIAQCKVAGIRVFMKQLGAHAIDSSYRAGAHAPEDKRSLAIAKALGQEGYVGFNLVLTKDGKGGDPLEWPEDLRVREFPA